MLSKLQYISQGKSALEQENNIRKALDNGADWIQIRWKNGGESERLALSEKVLNLCQTYKAVCIINDAIAIAKAIDADGVHLGLKDEAIEKARTILGNDKIIGGTANTVADIIQRTKEGCDYIGLGPFRFTTTKENLSPILGLEGYQNIIQILKEQSIQSPPIYAIGGIELSDIGAIKATGIYGIALSGIITGQPQLISQIKTILQ